MYLNIQYTRSLLEGKDQKFKAHRAGLHFPLNSRVEGRGLDSNLITLSFREDP